MSRQHLLLLIAALALTALVACDENQNVAEGDTAFFTLVPAEFALNLWAHAERSPVVIEVQGGSAPFTWTLLDGAMGALADTNDIYARVLFYEAVAGQEGINTIGVRDRNGWEAHSQVWQDTLSLTLEGAPAATPNVLTLTPEITGTGTNAVTNFTVRIDVTIGGGELPMQWEVGNASLGDIFPTDGRFTWYERSTADDSINSIRVTDARGVTVAATILQTE